MNRLIWLVRTIVTAGGNILVFKISLPAETRSLKPVNKIRRGNRGTTGRGTSESRSSDQSNIVRLTSVDN